MITLCMDTSSKYLVLAIIKDGKILGSVEKECWKNQSELIFPELNALLEKLNLTSDDIDEIVITEGPGSYTGVRIAMSIAKVFCALKNKPLATLGTLQLFAGDTPKCRVVLDARGKRVYTGVFENGSQVGDLEVIECETLIPTLNKDDVIIGDGELVGRNQNMPNLAENFLKLKDKWKYVENVHTLVPEYLKSSDSYMVKK